MLHGELAKRESVSSSIKVDLDRLWRQSMRAQWRLGERRACKGEGEHGSNLSVVDSPHTLSRPRHQFCILRLGAK